MCCDLPLQRAGAGHFGDETQFPSKTNRFDPRPLLFLFVNVVDTPSIHPRMGRLVDDSGPAKSFERHCFRQKQIVHQARKPAKWDRSVRGHLGSNAHSLKVVNDTGILQLIMMLDQLERLLDTAQGGIGLYFLSFPARAHRCCGSSRSTCLAGLRRVVSWIFPSVPIAAGANRLPRQLSPYLQR